jgi:sugar lactone lactonase YvrE
MKTIALLVLIFFINQSLFSQEKIFQSDKLKKIWETPKELQTPESVFYDPVMKILFVANINGKPTDKDGNGFISIVALDGKVTDLKWMTGLNAPKGMGMFNGILYVTDIDRVAAIDIINREIKKFYEFPEAKFLNDIAVDKNGNVFISDMMSTRIYRIFNGKSEIWLDEPVLTNPNGLFVENDKLMIGCKQIFLADIQNKGIKTWLEGTGGIDGLEGTGDGRYLFSDWSGNVYLVGTDKKIEKILDTTPVGMNAADIEFIPEKRLLLVPTFGDNRVMAYELK